MSAQPPIRSLFASDINRAIEEVIKVDQRDEEIVCDEIAEYVVTDSIRSRYTTILDKYFDTPKHPHEGIGVWVSGFYGSGKSSFAKMVGLAIGSYAGGKIARSGKNLGALFCWTQIITGLYVLVSPALFLVVNSVDARIFLLQTSHETLSIKVRALMLFSVLAVPISLIGAGFPILSSFLGKRHIPSLYYLNAVGSVVGAFVVSFFFLEKLGVRSSATLLSIGLILLNIIVLFVTKKSAIFSP